MITLLSDRKLVAEMNKLKQLQTRMKSKGLSEIKDDLLDELTQKMKSLEGSDNKVLVYSTIKKLNERLEYLLKIRL